MGHEPNGYLQNPTSIFKEIHEKFQYKRSIMKDKLLRYSMQLAMLKQLLDKELITENEYTKIKIVLMQDYGVISELCT